MHKQKINLHSGGRVIIYSFQVYSVLSYLSRVGKCKSVGKVVSRGGLGCASAIATNYKQYFLSSILCCLLSTNLKIKIYRNIILPVVLYGCET